MAFRGFQVTVTDTPVRLFTGRDGETVVHNRGAVSVFLGDNGVTDAGYEVAAGEAFGMHYGHSDHVYAVCAAGQTTTVHVAAAGQ